jgi:hypothetical protein
MECDECVASEPACRRGNGEVRRRKSDRSRMPEHVEPRRRPIEFRLRPENFLSKPQMRVATDKEDR